MNYIQCNFIWTIRYFSSLYKDWEFIEKTKVTNNEIADSVDKIRQWMNNTLSSEIWWGYTRVTELIDYKVEKRLTSIESVNFIL